MLETERKFLVCGPFRHLADKKTKIQQAFLNSDPTRSVRVRIMSDQAFLTIKGELQKDGISRLEVEIEISLSEAEKLFSIAESSPIEKTR